MSGILLGSGRVKGNEIAVGEGLATSAVGREEVMTPPELVVIKNREYSSLDNQFVVWNKSVSGSKTVKYEQVNRRKSRGKKFEKSVITVTKVVNRRWWGTRRGGMNLLPLPLRTGSRDWEYSGAGGMGVIEEFG